MQSTGIRVIFESYKLLLDGLGNTLMIAIVSLFISFFSGFIFGIFRMSKNRIIKCLTDIYLEAFRIIPLMVWLFSFFFFIPRILNINISGEFASILVFTMWGTAEMGDIVRGALESLPKTQLESLPKTQLESGLSVGLSKIQLFIYIQFPQAIRRIIPAAISLATRMIKTTSLVVLIGVVDVIQRGQQIIERTKESFWIYSFLFILFFIICYPLSLLSKKLETKWES
ncbi:MAG: amino acid ABC transporter permease [Clostridiales bacterium]|nr:amino acid ABC transporter permease [Clostridiales bacterium]